MVDSRNVAALWRAGHSIDEIAERTGAGTYAVFCALEESGISPWNHEAAAQQDDPPGGFTLWPHQTEAIVATVAGLGKHNRGQLVMASGSGKTLTALHIAAEMKAQRVLLAFPSLALLSQTMRVWRSSEEFGDFRMLAVCSDTTVGIPATTDSNEVWQFMNEHADAGFVVLVTYQSSEQVLDASAIVTFDIAILDEAHRCAGAADGTFGALVHADYAAMKFLFVTATPRVVQGEHMLSMDDLEMFGPRFYTLTLSDAIELGVLADYRVVVTLVEEDVEGSESAIPAALIKAMRANTLKRVVTFHNRVDDASRFAEQLSSLQSAWGGSWLITHLHGGMSTAERDAVLNQLRTLEDVDAAVVSNVKVLGEGVDVPALDGIAFMAGRSSEIEVAQALGRVLRRTDTNTIGTVFLPVLVPKGTDPLHALDRSEFSPIWAILRALWAHDCEFSTRLQNATRQIAAGISPELDSRILVTGLEVSERFIHALSTRIVFQTVPSWQRAYEEFRFFCESNGHGNVPQDYVSASGLALGQWVNTQRSAYQRNELPSDRVRSLESAFGWSWTAKDGMFLQHMSRFEEAIRNGPPYDDVPKGLREFVTRTRRAYRQGSLADYEIAMLDEIPEWSWSRSHHAFKQLLRDLQKYADQHGDVAVPQRHESGLGNRLHAMRAKIKRGEVPREWVEKLQQLPGWSLSPAQRMGPEQIRRAQELLARGHSLRAIGIELGVTHNTVKAALGRVSR